MDDITAQTQDNTQPQSDLSSSLDNGQSAPTPTTTPQQPVKPVKDEPDLVKPRRSFEMAPAPIQTQQPETTVTPSVETIPIRESLPQQEVHKAPETPTQQVKKDPQNNDPVDVGDVQLTQEEKGHVVDKRKEHGKLNSVAENADKITTLADLEEEEFIHEVEEHHES